MMEHPLTTMRSKFYLMKSLVSWADSNSNSRISGGEKKRKITEEIQHTKRYISFLNSSDDFQKSIFISFSAFLLTTFLILKYFIAAHRFIPAALYPADLFFVV